MASAAGGGAGNDAGRSGTGNGRRGGAHRHRAGQPAQPAPVPDRLLDQEERADRDDQGQRQPQREQPEPGQAGVRSVDELEERPVPEVDTVGDAAEPDQRRQGEQPGGGGGGTDHGVGEYGGDRERDAGQPALVEPAGGAVRVGPRPPGAGGTHQRERAEDRVASTAAGPEREGCGQRTADEQRLGPAVRAEVGPVDVGRAVQGGGGQGGRGRAEQADPEQRQPRRAAGVPVRARGVPPAADRQPGQQTHHDQRPEQVELLLDAERPGVLQRRGRRGLREVVAAPVDHPPVRHVRQGGQRVPAQQPHLDRRQQVPAGHRHHNQHDQ
jgi:hypothetical protein